jgi:hypothetical protein
LKGSPPECSASLSAPARHGHQTKEQTFVGHCTRTLLSLVQSHCYQ